MPRVSPSVPSAAPARVTFAPALRILGLLALAVAALMSSSWWALGSLLAVPLVWWVAHGKSVARLARLLRRTGVLVAMLLVSFVLVPPSGPPWDVDLGPWTVNLAGLAPGGRMCLRLLTIIVGSLALRETGRPRDLLTGLRQLRLPLPVAQTIDATLALVGDGGRGRRRGRGGGGGGGRGGGRGSEPDATTGVWATVRSGREAMAGRLLQSLDDNIARGTEAIAPEVTEEGQGRGAHVASDAAVVTALAVMSMSVKFLKILPGIPFASGHKLVVILPLYFAAARLTRSRLGATWMGITLGVVSFLFGEGRFGILELVKYVAPGLLLDAIWPLVRNRRSVVLFSFLGLLLGIARFGSTLLAGWIAQAPPIFYAIAGGTGLMQFGFATLSGPVTWAFLKALDRSETAGAEAVGDGAGDGDARRRRERREEKV